MKIIILHVQSLAREKLIWMYMNMKQHLDTFYGFLFF